MTASTASLDREARHVRRFWAQVRPDSSGCWLWTGLIQSTGYGSFAFRRDGRNGYAHRAAYEMVKGPIPSGLTIDHLCRVPACVNPDHLEAVTQRENTLRSPLATPAINARKSHCIRGHAFTPPNLWPRPRPNGVVWRRCRSCERARREAA